MTEIPRLSWVLPSHIDCRFEPSFLKEKNDCRKANSFIPFFFNRFGLALWLIGVFIGTQTFSVPTSSRKALISGWARSTYYSRLNIPSYLSWSNAHKQTPTNSIRAIKMLWEVHDTLLSIHFNSIQYNTKHNPCHSLGRIAIKTTPVTSWSHSSSIFHACNTEWLFFCTFNACMLR